MHKTMSLGSCHFILEQTWSAPCLRKTFPKMAGNLAADSRDPQTMTAAETMSSYDEG